jgi:uncharacterized protein (TIGR03437 family)
MRLPPFTVYRDASPGEDRARALYGGRGGRRLIVTLFTLSALACCAFARASAAGCLSFSQTARAEPGGTHLASGDFDGDGDRDLAVSLPDSDSVAVRLGDGAGNFGPAKNFGAGGKPGVLAVGDFNGDGKQDVAAVNLGAAGGASLLLGDRAGNLGGPSTFAAPRPLSQSLAAADFNGDVKLDLAVSHGGRCHIEGCDANKVAVLLGDGAGGFGAPADFPAGFGPGTVVAADFNGDHKTDLALSTFVSSHSTFVLLGDGAGGFGAPTQLQRGGRGVVSGDFNEDGKPDLAVGDSTLSVFLGDGAGGFGAPSSLDAGGVVNNLVAADFDSDGHLDLAFGKVSTQFDGVSVSTGDGLGGFAPPVNVPTGILFQFVSPTFFVVAGDFDEDGRTDLVQTGFADAQRSAITTALNSTPAACPAPTPTPAPLPLLSLDAAPVAEGNTGTANAVVTVTLSHASSQTVTVDYATVESLANEGRAVAGEDFLPVSGTLVFEPGVTSRTVNVPVVGDTIYEGIEEAFGLSFSNAVNATLGTNTGVRITIPDADPAPTVTINDATAQERDAGANADMVFSICQSFTTGAQTVVNYVVENGTAVGGADFLPAHGTQGSVTINPGELCKPVTVTVVGDDSVEPDETVIVRLNGGFNFAGQSRPFGVGTVVNDDAPVLQVDGATGRAVALDSVLFTTEPFALFNPLNFSADRRTRVILFFKGARLLAGEDASVVTAQATHSQGNLVALPVEFVGPLPGADDLVQVVVRLPDGMPPGDARVTVSVRGAASNEGLIAIAP